MFRHAVLIEFAPAVGDVEIVSIVQATTGLPARIPGVVAAVCGRDAGVTPGSSDFAIVVDLDDRSAYADYVAHPAHVELTSLLAPWVQSRTVVDFEVSRGGRGDE